MTKKILVVDDEAYVRRLVSVTLADKRYELFEAYDSTTALEVTRRERPSLVVLDLRIPGADGLEVCQAIKQDPELHETLIVVLSGFALDRDQQRARAAGADAFVAKPFSPLRLIALVEQLLN